MFYLATDFHDPAFNLALEEQLLRSMPPDHPGYFLLWRNGPSVIIGRHQCAEEEINVPFVRGAGLPVVRRITGGGAVYHDLGNLNFSFIENVPGHGVDFGRYLERVRLALAAVGVRAKISGRNDMEVEGRKISGSGQIRLGGKILHHGTLLVNADLDRLGDALRAGQGKIRSRGVASVRARVRNIAECWAPGTTLETLKTALADACADVRGEISTADTDAACALAEVRYRQRAWNFGSSPPFDLERRERFPWGELVLRLGIRRGHIENCRIHGDFFSSADIGDLEARLEGVEFSAPALELALADINWPVYFTGSDSGAMRRFFAEAALDCVRN